MQGKKKKKILIDYYYNYILLYWAYEVAQPRDITLIKQSLLVKKLCIIIYIYKHYLKICFSYCKNLRIH